MSNFIDNGALPHLLLHGPPGTGKTSTALACARRMYGDGYRSMILEVRKPHPLRFSTPRLAAFSPAASASPRLHARGVGFGMVEIGEDEEEVL